MHFETVMTGSSLIHLPEKLLNLLFFVKFNLTLMSSFKNVKFGDVKPSGKKVAECRHVLSKVQSSMFPFQINQTGMQIGIFSLGIFGKNLKKGRFE